MKTARLHRFEMTDTACRGVLTVDDRYVAVTLERPWADNRQLVSCIPAGRYLCRRVKSPSYGDTFEVTGVAGRSHILFHWGNWPKNSKGCILLGEKLTVGKDEITNSRAACATFMSRLAPVDEFELLITEA